MKNGESKEKIWCLDSIKVRSLWSACRFEAKKKLI